MSGILMALMAAGGFRVVASPKNVGSTDSSGGACLVTFKSDGSLTFWDDGSTVTTAWGTPTTTGAGAGYWIQATLGTGNGVMTGTYGSPLQLSSDRSFNMNGAGTGVAKNRTVTYQIATDSGMTNVVLTGTLTYGSTPIE